jgi:hypothetical protein
VLKAVNSNLPSWSKLQNAKIIRTCGGKIGLLCTKLGESKSWGGWNIKPTLYSEFRPVFVESNYWCEFDKSIRVDINLGAYSLQSAQLCHQ